MTNNYKYVHNFACVCSVLDFVKTIKDGRRIGAHAADKSCAFPKTLPLLNYHPWNFIDALHNHNKTPFT